jgi:hypothetical protein
VYLKLWSTSQRWSADGYETRDIAKNVSDIEKAKNPPVHSVLKPTLFVDLQQNLGELIISITYCHTTIILYNTLHLYKGGQTFGLSDLL